MLGKLISLFSKEKCPHCAQNLRYLGDDKEYAKFSYYLCENRLECDLQNIKLIFKHGRYSHPSRVRILEQDGKNIHLYHMDEGNQYWMSLY